MGRNTCAGGRLINYMCVIEKTDMGLILNYRLGTRGLVDNNKNMLAHSPQ